MPEERSATVEKKEGIRIPVRMENGVTKSSDNEFMFCFDDPTKVDISSTTGAATWTTGDQIVLCESNGVHTKWLYGDVDVETSEVTVTLDDGYSCANYAIYPASAATSNFTTPTVVYADSYSMDDVANPETFSMAPMVAINSGQLNFYHVGAVLRLSLHYIPLGTRKIRVTFNGMTYVTGIYSVSNPGTASASTSVTSGSHNYVEFTKSTDFELDTTLNIPLPIGDYSSCTGLTIGYYDASASLSFSHAAEFSYMSLVRASGKKGVGYAATDLSLVHPITRAEMLRETANCYVVTGPGRYFIPLYYGNSIVGGVDNLSNAAPDSKFVNIYGTQISSGNIIEDLDNCGQPLLPQGGVLLWSTANSTSDGALLSVDPGIITINDVGYLFFNVPTEGYTAGSALIGLRSSYTAKEYVWNWHIWFTEGPVLFTEEYTNYEGQKINFLNLPLGGRTDSHACVLYRFGFPHPYPPAQLNSSTMTGVFGGDYNGSSYFSLTNTASGYYFNTQLKFPQYRYTNLSLSTSTLYNLWDATQTTQSVIFLDKAVVKTIYDPSPAGMSVPRKNAFTGFTLTGQNTSNTNLFNVIGSYNNGFYFRKNNNDVVGSLWKRVGYLSNSGYTSSTSGYYWISSAYQTNYSNVMQLYFGASSVNVLYTGMGQSNGLAVRPALCE